MAPPTTTTTKTTPPPIAEIDLEKNRGGRQQQNRPESNGISKQSFPTDVDVDSQLSSLRDDDPLDQIPREKVARVTFSRPPSQIDTRHTNKAPRFTYSKEQTNPTADSGNNKRQQEQHEERKTFKSLRRIRNKVSAAGKVMSRSDISSLTSCSISTTTSMANPTKPQDIFRTKEPPTSAERTTTEGTTTDAVGTMTPERKNGTVHDLTPLRNNLATPPAPPPPPSTPPPPQSTTTRGASNRPESPTMIPLPASYSQTSLNENNTMTTNTSSILDNMTKRAVENVLDTLLFEDEVEVQGSEMERIVKDEEEDSYFGGSKEEQDTREDEAAIGPSTSASAKESAEVNNPFEENVVENTIIENDRVTEEATNDGAIEDDNSYFDRDMDVSSLTIEDALSTLEKEQGAALEWARNVRSLRHKNTSNDAKSLETADSNIHDDAPKEDKFSENIEMKESDVSVAIDVDDVYNVENSASSKSFEERSAGAYSPLIRSLQQQETEEDTIHARQSSRREEGEIQAMCQPNAASESLPLAHEYDDVSLSSNKSKELIMAVGSPAARHSSSASWWQDDDNDDEEAGMIPRASLKQSKAPSLDEEPFTLRKTFMFLFLIVGVAAITGGIAALIVNQTQNRKSNDQANVQASSPPRISPPPSPPSIEAPAVPPTATPSILPTITNVSTLTTEQPTSQAITTVSTSSPTTDETSLPTINHERLTLHEKIELFSPESLPYLENTTSPQAQALEWALQQSNASMEQYSLATLLFSSTDDWINDEGWLSNSSVCDWYGIVCRDDKVVELTLSFNNLASTLPDELSLLTDLQVLSISGAAGTGNDKGRLVGTIPSTWGERLVNLVALELYDNELTGQLPTSFQYLNSLEMLDVDGNQLFGPLPTELGAMTSLDILDISKNYFSGTIPTEIGLLNKLVNLKIQGNELTGTLPTQLSGLKSLKELHAQNNVLMGSPRTLYAVQSLTWLDLSGNGLEGNLPPSIGLLSNLEGLLLDDNRFSGPIPVQLALMSDLRVLDLAKNLLTGSVPHQLGELSNLVTLSLETNLLEGKVPDEICDNDSLKDFSYSDDCQECPCCTDCVEDEN